MKMHFTKMLAVSCAILFGALVTTEAFAQGETCETAVAVTPGTYTADGPNSGISSPICDATVGSFADWYSYTPDMDGFISVNSCLGGADTQLSIFSGSCAALVCEGSNDDSCPTSEGGSSFASEVNDLPVVGGITYYIQWDNDWSTAGFDWTLIFVESLPLDCEGVEGGSALPDTPCDDGNPDTFNDTYQADCSCAGIPYDCPNQQNIGDACDDGNPDTFNDIVQADCSCAGTPYDCPNQQNIGDACDDGDAATFNDIVQADCSCAGVPAGPGSDCNSSVEVTPGTYTADPLLGEGFDNACAFATPGVAARWYHYTPAVDGFITVESCLGGADTRVSILSGACGALVCEANADDDCPTVEGGPGFASQVLNLAVVGGVTYYIQWDDRWTDSGFDWSLTFVENLPIDCEGVEGGSALPDTPCDDGNPDTINDTYQEDCSCQGELPPPPPANDTCEGVTAAFFLSCDETISGSTASATITPDINTTCNGFTSTTAEDVWFAFQSNGIDNYTLTLDPGEDNALDGVMFIYSGDCSALVEVACADDGFVTGTGEVITLEAPPAGIYYVRIFNWAFGPADYSLTLTCESNCVAPFPAVDEASLNTTLLGNGVLTEWAPVQFQIGCQIQARFAGGAILGATVVAGTNAGSFVIPGSFLQLGTDYEWRVRCGCSQNPLVVGPWSSWQPFTTPGGVAISASPNPTEGQSFVTFTLSEETYTTLEVIDMSGRVVGSVFAGMAQADNEYRFEFDGSDLPNGVYIYRLTTEDEVVNEKFMIAR